MRPNRHMVLSDSVLVDDGGRRVRIVLQSSTGQVYVLAESVLRTMMDEPASLPGAVVHELTTAGLVVDDGCDEFSAVVNENIVAGRDVSRRTFVLMPSAYCNMGCGYCGQQHFRAPQTAHHRQAIVSRIVHAVRDPATRELAVNWF